MFIVWRWDVSLVETKMLSFFVTRQKCLVFTFELVGDVELWRSVKKITNFGCWLKFAPVMDDLPLRI
jgi:hypothetical protein